MAAVIIMLSSVLTVIGIFAMAVITKATMTIVA